MVTTPAWHCRAARSSRRPLLWIFSGPGPHAATCQWLKCPRSQCQTCTAQLEFECCHTCSQSTSMAGSGVHYHMAFSEKRKTLACSAHASKKFCHEPGPGPLAKKTSGSKFKVHSASALNISWQLLLVDGSNSDSNFREPRRKMSILLLAS